MELTFMGLSSKNRKQLVKTYIGIGRGPTETKI